MSHGAVSPSFGRFKAIQVVRHEGPTTHYAAFDPELDRQVALVTTPAGRDLAEENRLAFRLPRMRHPNIVSVLDAGLEGDMAFVAAECLQTEALSAFFARPGRMPFFQGLPLVLQLLSAIEHAQARRLVHSGIDMEHLQVTPGGQPKLPAAGWSLSADRQPNLEDAARVARIVLWDSCPPALRGPLEQVLLRAEAQDPAARYQRPDEFILALLAAAGYAVGPRSAAVDLRTVAAPQPAQPIPRAEPVEAVRLAEPVEPIRLKEPVEPVRFTEPVEPIRLREPVEPVLLAERVEPVLLPDPVDPIEPVLLAHPVAPRTAVEPVLHMGADPTRAVRHAPRRPLPRRRTGHHVLAACLLAALFVPRWVGERVFDGSPGAPRSSATVALGAPPSAVQPALVPAPAANIAPAPVAPAPIAPAAAAPATVALASMTAPPVHTRAVEPAPAETPPVERPAEPSRMEAAPAAPSRATPSSIEPSTSRPVAVTTHSPAAKPAARPAVRQRPPHLRQFALAEPVRTKPAAMHGRAARLQRARVVTAASGCPYDLPVFRELCEARQCSRFELRNDPTCVRMRSEQRAALARLRGTPD